jgi:GT2 family glycosyltransferase
MSDAPDLTLSIVSYHVADELRDCLSSALEAAPRHSIEVLVVDNASGPATHAVLDAFEADERVTSIRNDENRGFAAANNQALRLASGRYFMLLNPDCRVLDDALSVLVEAMDADPQIGACAPQLLDEEGEVSASCRQLPTLESAFWHLSYMDKFFPNAPRIGAYMMGDFDHQEDRDVDQPQGAALLFDRELLGEIGELDERFFLYFEEVDWCRRVLGAGRRIRFLSSSRVQHLAGRSADQVWGRAIHHFFESMIRYYRKAHGPWSANAVKTMVIGGAALRMGAWTLMGKKLGLTPEVRRSRIKAFTKILKDLKDF